MEAIDRRLITVYTPKSHQGFLGKGHTARPVIAVDYPQSDPFIMLMDDWLDKTDNVPVGGPHPHAGFETVTYVLEGEIGDGSHSLKAGDVEKMTAGRGVIHTETISKPLKMRILQLWLNLPKKDRHALPSVQRVTGKQVPRASREGVNIGVYSGEFAGVASPLKNYTPLILADIVMQPGTSITEELPANFSAFLYVINGRINVGENNQALGVDEVGWLDRRDVSGLSRIKLTAGEEGARVVLYAAQPQGDEIVSHGPFIADSMEDIRRLYADYRAGKMHHISEMAVS